MMMKRLLSIVLLLIPFIARPQCGAGDTVTVNTVSNITTSSAILSGTFPVNGSITAFTLTYVREGQTDTINTTAGAFARSLVSLQAGTTYRYYWTTNCGVGVNIRQAGYYTFTTLGASIVYTPMQNLGYRFQYLRADSSFALPLRDTSIYLGVNRAGAIIYKSGTGFYGYNGNYWISLKETDTAGLSGRINARKNNSDSTGNSGYATLFQYNKGKDSLQANIALKSNIAGPTFTDSVIINSTTGSLRPPRMTQTQRDALTPTTGDTLFCTDCTANDASTGVIQTYNGTAWKNHY